MSYFFQSRGDGGRATSGLVRLETERLVLRHGGRADVSAIVDYLKANREFHRPFEPRRPETFYSAAYWEQTVEEDLARFRTDVGVRLFLFPKGAEHTVVGIANLNNIVRGAFQAAHLGYGLDCHQQGKGLMGEALTSLLDFGFGTLNLHRIMANYLPDNHRSAKLLGRLGFETEGTAKAYLLIDGGWRDHVLTSRVHPNWRTS